jgi:hypothetical protein
VKTETTKKRKRAAAAPPAAEPGSPTDLAAEKLRASGLEARADDLGMKGLTKKECHLLLGFAWPPSPAALFIPYADQDGEPTDFFRVRRLGPVEENAFTGPRDEAELGKYRQRVGTGTHLYYPPLIEGRTWREYLAERDGEGRPRRVVLCEGELKSMAATLAGVPTIGLGGVDSVYGEPKEFHPELAALCEGGREVVIAFDSDVVRKGGVVQAETRLASLLTDAGASVRIARVPDVDGLDKTGLDDLVVHRGPEAMVEAIDEAEEYEGCAALHEFNERWALSRSGNCVIELATGEEKSWKDFEMLTRNDTHRELGGEKDGKPTSKRVETSKAWLAWPRRLEVAGTAYVPGAGLLAERSGRVFYNTWKRWGVAAKEGDLSLWRALLDHVFAGAEPAHRLWVERWLAYPLQHPGAKLSSAVVLWSHAEGAGKGLIGELMAKIYGERTDDQPWGNCQSLNKTAIDSSFSSWIVDASFVIGEEITGGDSHAGMDVLKDLITNPVARVNRKYRQEYSIANRVNFYFTSNRPKAFALSEEDRRFFVHEVSAKMDQELGDRIGAWKDGDGPSALRWHLERLDLGDFNPKARPPLTEAKAAMAKASTGDVTRFVAELTGDAAAGEVVGALFDPALELLTAQELGGLYEKWKVGDGAQRMSGSMLANALEARGCHQRSVKRKGDRTERLWAVREAAKWKAAAPKEWAAHRDAHAPKGHK